MAIVDPDHPAGSPPPDRAAGESFIRTQIAATRARWRPLTIYQKFEDGVIAVLTLVIAFVIVSALWGLIHGVFVETFSGQGFGAFDPGSFQAIFAMIFTVIIALEFQRSLLTLTERRRSIVQVRTVVLIALLAVLRKVILIDLTQSDALLMFGLAATIFALGGVFWLVRDQDRRAAK
jgi:uncharacterized membrane protein (DUF373 family)